jgi:hypothetical protein
MVRRRVNVGMVLLKCVLWVAIAIAILVLTMLIARWTNTHFGTAGTAPLASTAYTNLAIPGNTTWGQLTRMILSLGATNTNDVSLAAFVMHLAIFVMVLFACAEMIETLSTFSQATSWVIGLGLAIIAGVGGVYSMLAKLMGLTATLGALAVTITVIGAFVAAITFNIGLGKTLRRWRWDRQAEIEQLKATQGGTSVRSAIMELKGIQKYLSQGEAKKW